MVQMTSASAQNEMRQNNYLEVQILEHLNIRNGSIQFWGEWFGRPFDNYHTVIETCWIKEDVLIIKFDQGEVATISRPVNIVASEEKFFIQDASIVIFEWYYYGRKHTPENLCRLEYRSINDSQVICSIPDSKNKKLNKNGFFAMEIA